MPDPTNPTAARDGATGHTAALNEAEREALWNALHSGPTRSAYETVERIVAARVAAAVEQARAETLRQVDAGEWLTDADARAVAAEAERDRLREAVDRVTVLGDRWARLAGEAMNPDSREWLTAASNSLRAILAASPAPQPEDGCCFAADTPDPGRQQRDEAPRGTGASRRWCGCERDG